MVNFDGTKRKRYNQHMTSRQRTLRFLKDNIDTYADYPENTQYLIDRDDIVAMNYYTKELLNTCIYTGGFLSFTSTIPAVFYIKRLPKTYIRGLAPICILPLVSCICFHNYKLKQFLDYAYIKYQHRGLWDEDLWNFHATNNEGVPDNLDNPKF